MAASPTPRPIRAATSAEAPGDAALAAWAQRHRPDIERAPIAIAFSGGADSTALLLAAQARWGERVLAIHIHHGLQAAANGFEAHARELCAARGIALRVRHLDARPLPGQSPEDAARRARYSALADEGAAAAASWVLLAHHRDDQAETLMLALSRGAGLPGLAAMPEAFERHGMRFGRPWLSVSGAALRGHLREQGVPFVEDPTNRDEHHPRNRLRARVMPVLYQAFPGFAQAVARSAAHAAQAQHLLDELATIDLTSAGEPPAIAALQHLSRDRQANALRHWLRQAHGVAPSAAQLTELLDQLAACRTRGHRIEMKVASGVLRRQGERLSWTPSV